MSTKKKTKSPTDPRFAGWFRIDTFEVAGLKYTNYPLCLQELQNGADLELVRDPANAHDKKAVKVLFNTTHIGWLPAAKNEFVSRLMDEEVSLRAVVLEHDTAKPLYSRLQINVYMPLILG